MKFDYKDIPEKTRLINPLKYDKIHGTSRDIDVEAKTIFEDMESLGWKMVKSCVVNNGVGLAAPQLGIKKKAFVMVDLENPDVWKFDGTMSLYINPSFVPSKDSELVMLTEGCLSVPGKRLEIKRPNKILTSYWYFDSRKKIKFCKDDPMEGHAARMFQHEYDHLTGGNIVQLYEDQVFGKRKGKRTKKR